MFTIFHQRIVVVLALLLVPTSAAQADSTSATDDGLKMTKIADSKETPFFLLDDIVENNLKDQRELTLSSSVPCNGGAGPTNYFSLQFNLTPQGGWDLSQCTSSKIKELGNALNNFLLDYGIGPSGVGDQTAFLAEVCNNAAVNTVTRNRGRKLILAWAFVYNGGGACKVCNQDDFDGRRELQLRGRTLQTSTDPNWFNNIFKPEMQNKLRNAFTTSIAPLHKTCLGNGPQVEPIITKTNSMVNMSC